MARILIVDDETSVITVLREMLTRLGYDVLTASDAARALELISLGGIDVIITDIVMPNMSGIELIIELKKQFPKLKIIAISGGSLQEGPDGYLARAQKLGVARCLKKPFMLDTLSAMIQELLAE